MRAALPILFALLLGCRAPDDDTPTPGDTDQPSSDTDDDTDTDTDTEANTVTADGIAVTCTPQADNALRFDCAVVLDTAGTAEIHFNEADGPTRIRASEGSKIQHDIVLWGMRPETEHSFTVWVDGVEGPSGTVTTGSLPEPLSDIAFTFTGTDPVAEHVALPLSCGGEGHSLIVGADGDIFWYQPYEGFSAMGLNLTDDGGVILQVDNTVQEYGFDGETRLILEQRVDFDHPPHHDAFKYDGRIYALFADTYPVGNEVAVVDGFYVFDSTGLLLDQWELFDHLDLTEADLANSDDRFWAQDFPGALDFSHANAVFVDDSGITLSTRWISTVWRIGGYDTPDFGTVQWRLTGEADSPITTDLALSSAVTEDVDFIGQHHATIAPDGTLTLFDNRVFGSTSRVLALDIDPVAGSAEIVDTHDLPVVCNIQGSASRTANGDMLGNCTTNSTLYHFRAGTPEPSYTMTTLCSSGTGFPGPAMRPGTPRAQPVDLGPA